MRRRKRSGRGGRVAARSRRCRKRGGNLRKRDRRPAPSAYRPPEVGWFVLCALPRCTYFQTSSAHRGAAMERFFQSLCARDIPVINDAGPGGGGGEMRVLLIKTIVPGVIGNYYPCVGHCTSRCSYKDVPLRLVRFETSPK